MNWTDFFLICFAVGVTFSVISLLAGSMHLHWPHFHVHFGPGGPAPAGGQSGGRGGASPVNVGTVAAFLAWFGVAGYLISQYWSTWIVIALGGAVVSGFLGAAIVFLFLARVLMRRDETLDPADYEMVGVLGKVSSRIGGSGTGEMFFSQAGARRAAPARSENGAEIPKGMEVVVTRYERGVAYVRPWEEFEQVDRAK